LELFDDKSRAFASIRVISGRSSDHRKFQFDKAAAAPSVPGMATPEKKSFSLVSLVIDLVLVAVAFVIFYRLVESHVPSNDPAMIHLWGGLAAGCMAGVFWLAWQMLKVVYRFQRDTRK
jgi:hypothetical protein